MQAILSAINVCKVVPVVRGELEILQAINLQIYPGESVAVLGASGSGKTTLLSLLAGLDSVTSGEIELAGTSLSGLNEAALAKLRGRHVGFVFQSFQLLGSLTALENVMLPLELQAETKAAQMAADLLQKVGLADRAEHYPNQLSGGEQQRVAIARAFASRPDVLFADEPTGNLDTETGEHITNLMLKLNEDLHTTLVLVTHDAALAACCQRAIRLHKGRLVSSASA